MPVRKIGFYIVKEVHPKRSENLPAIQEFTELIRKLFGSTIIDIIVYGSVARGEDKEDSDIDILVIGRTNDWRFERELIKVAYDIGLDHGVYLSIKYISQDEYHKYQSFSFYKNIQREGISVGS